MTPAEKLAAAHALLAEILEADDEAIQGMEQLGIAPDPVITGLTERIRTLLTTQGAYDERTTKDHVRAAPG